MKKKYLVIGLGRFGSSVARTLTQLGGEVLAVDRNEKVVQEALDYSEESMQLDVTRKESLKAVEMDQFEAVCICIGNEQTSIMASLLCVEMGAAKVIAKAQSDMQAEVLNRIGVKQVVFPERDAGMSLAHKLISSDILQSIALSPDYSTAEFNVAPEWVGKTLLELEFRGKYGLSVIGIRHGEEEELNINPRATDPILIDDRIYVIGSTRNIGKVEALLRKRSKDS